MSMTDHAAGVGTCTQGMTIPSYLSSEMHLQKFFDQTKCQSWIVNFRAEVYAKARNKRRGTNISYSANWRIEFCSNRDNCNFPHKHATGRRETMWKGVGDAKRSHLEHVSSSVPKVKEQTDVKSSNSPKASPATRVENSLSMVDKMNNIVM